MEEKLAMDNSSLRVLIRDLDQFGDLSLLKAGTLLFLVDLPNVIDECLGDPSKCAAWVAKAEETKKNSKTFAEDEEAFFENLHATGLQSTGGGMGAAEARAYSILYYTLVPGYSNSSPSLSKLEFCLVKLKPNMSIVFRTQLGYVFDYPGYEMMVGRLIFKYQVMNNLLLVTSNKIIEGDRRNPKVSTNRPTDVNEYSTRRDRLYKEGPFSNFYNQGILNTFQKDEKENIQVSNLLNIYKKLADEKKFNGGLYYADIIMLVRYHNRVHIDVQTGAIPKSNIDKIDTFEAHFKRLMERLKDNRKLLFTQAQPFKWLLDRTSWCLIDSANPSLGLDTIFSDIETYFEKSAFAQGIHFDHYSYEEVEFYSPHFEDQISIMFPRSTFTTKIMFGLDPSFVIELFSSARFRMTDTRRFTQAETISHLGYFIGKMSADMDALFLFICKCLCSFKTTSVSKKLDSAGILKACVFLLDLIKQSEDTFTKKILAREKNEGFYQKIYLASVAIAVSSVRAIEYEMLMTEELDVPTKPRFTHQDFSRYFLEVFLLDIISVAWNEEQEEMINTFFFKLFGNPELCRDLSKEFFLYYFDEDIKGCKNPNRKGGFKLIYAHKDESKGMVSAKMMEFLSEVITGKIVFKRYTLESFLTNLGGLSEHDKPENHFEQFLKANRISSVDSGILKALADSSENAAVKAYLAKSEDKHAVLIKYVLDFIKNFDKKLTVEKLAGIRKLSQEKVELIEYICAEGKEEKPKFLIKRVLQKQTELEGLTKVLGSIETVMEQSKNILSGHFPFYEKLISDLNTLKKDFNKMTIQELYAHPVYAIKNLIITPESVKSWMEHNILMTYPLIQQEVTAKHDETKPGLEGYLTIFKDVQANYKTLFTRMAENPATFKIKDFDKYVIQTGPRFILENKDCFIKNYEILNALKMSDPAKDAFMRAANILYSTKKLLKIGRADLNSSKIPEKKLGSMEKLLEILDIEISADKLGSKALDLYNQIKDVPEEEISVGLIKEKDHNKIIDIDGDNFGQSCMFIMPPLINQIAKSEETMEFIKTKADEFIKAMNEEVETENMDLLRMLDKVNKHLKFISDTRNFELIAKEIALKMSYDLQDELENCLQHIEPQMKTEIQYLAAKTKKDTQYNLTIIRGLLAKSEFTMSYNPLEGRFGIGVKYTHKKNDHDEHSASKDLSIFEFEELMNSAKVLTARKIDDDDQIEEEVESKRILISFSELGKHIEVILEALNKLKEIGAINESFTYLVDQMNISCGKERFFSKVDEDHMLLKFEFQDSPVLQDSRRDTKYLEACGSWLMKLFHTLENDLISSYTVKSYLSTLYSGKRLYYLTEYLRSNISPGSDEEEQIKSPITKYLGKDDIILKIDSAPGNDMMTLFQVVKQNFQKWSENCQEIDSPVKGKPQVYSSVFPSKKMKVCTSNLGSFTDYSTMLRVIACDLRQQNLLLSQILLCSLNISEYEIVSFCYRAILDPYKNFYFILDSGSLTVKMLSRLKDCIQELYKTHRDSMNYNMLIFAKDLGHFKEETVFEQCDNKVKELYQEAPEDPKMNVPKPLMKKSTLTETIDVMNMVLKKFGGVFMSTKAVKSDQAGMGKTTYIRNMISQITSLQATEEGQSHPELFLTGDMEMTEIRNRLRNLSESCNQCSNTMTHYCLVIKLDFIDNFEKKKSIIDYLLFTLCIVRSFYTEVGAINLTNKLKCVYIELSNMYKSKEKGIKDQHSHLQFINLLESIHAVKAKNNKENSDDKKNIIEIPKFDFAKVNYDSHPESKEQIVARLLHEKENRTWPGQSIISEAEFRQLLTKYYGRSAYELSRAKSAEDLKDNSDTTYSQYQYWLKSLAFFYEHLNRVDELSHRDIGNKNAGQSKKKSLREEVLEEILFYCSQVVNFSVKQAKESQERAQDIMAKGTNEAAKKPGEEEEYAKFVRGLQSWDANNIIVPLLDGKKPLFAFKCLHRTFNFPVVLAVNEKYVKENKDSKKPDGNKKPLKENWRVHNEKQLRVYIENNYANSFVNYELSKFQSNKNLIQTTYLKSLADYLGSESFESLEKSTKEFMGKGFVITDENYMKIGMILQKASLKIPIVIMGESGCGKTYLTQFICKGLLGDELKMMTLYSGVTETMFIRDIKEAFELAEKLSMEDELKKKESQSAYFRPRNVWVFFDEFNTSSLQSIVAEVMVDRVCSIDNSIRRVPDNVVFISCCNPYRKKTQREDIGLAPTKTETSLSHRVNPVPDRLLNYVWDFGQLTEEDDKAHIRNMVMEAQAKVTQKRAEYHSSPDFLFGNGGDDEVIPEMFRNNTERDSFINMLARTHNFVRNSVEKSGVSLRDVNRVILLYKWFNQKIQELKRLKENDKTITPAQMQYLFDPEKIWLRAATCALYLAYGLRMNGNYKVQRDLKDKMVDSITNNGLKFSEISATLEMMADIYLEKLREATNNRAIPQNVAINTPLKENFITMLACFDTYIPLIICGAPGTSKTLCSQIFDSALISSIIRSDRTKEFSTYQAIYSLYYGGSVTSTADGISKVYKRAQLYLEKKGEDRPVVIFDEIGLAELSPYNPLKVLHPLLEDEKLKVGFFGISNWTLDLSKMNRLIYLARPDMSVDDLRNIFQISINACKDPQVKAKLEYYLNIMANAYIELRKWQKVYSLHRDFHGSRDVYAVAKFMYNHIAKADSEANSALLIKYAIERNLNGWAYYFTPQTQPSDKGEKYLEIPFETIPGLDKFQATKEFDALRSLRIGDMGSPYDEKLPGDEALLRGKTIFSSSQVFKQIFVRLLKEASTKKVQGAAVTFNESLFGSSFMKETLVMEQIATNLRDSNSRFLLIRSEGEVVDNDFMDRLYKIMGQLNRRQDIVDWRGIKGKENSIDLLTTLKSYITDGKIVVMKNLDELHGSLYDLFNQKYTDIEGLKYCYLYFGESKHRVQVHPDFKTIVLLDAEKQLSREQIEKEQQAPFLNRFEKYFVSMANLQESEYDIKYIFHLVRYVQKIINNRPFRILGMSLDMLTSIYNRSKLVGRDRGPAEQTKEIRRLIFRMATSNLLLKEGLTNKEGDGDLALFEQEHEFDSLKDLLKSFVTDMKTTSRACVFTFSNPLELDPLKKTMEKNPERYRILTDEFLVTQGIEQRTSTLKKMTEPFLFVQFTKPINLELIASLKTSVRQNTNIKKCLLLFHLSRDYAQSEKINSNVGINFRDGWENYVIEYVNKNCYKDLVSSYGMSLTRLMSSDERDNKLELSVRLAKACTYRTLQMLSDSQSDKTLKDNFQQIQMMLNRDENNVYINELMTVIKRFTFDDSLWRRYVQQERFKLSVAEQRNYVDIQEAIQNVIFNSKRDDSSTESAVSIELIMRKFMIFINGELKNLASYAKYYNSDIEEKKLLYRNRFQMNLRIPLKEDLLNANHTFDHYLVPFYKYKYEKFFANYTSKRIEGNTSTVKQLKEAEMQFYHLRKQAGGQGNNAVLTSLREKIKRSETRLEEAMEELISEMVNQDSTEDNNNIMFDEFCSDLAIGMFRKIDVHQINTREDKIFEMKAKNKQMQELLYKNEEFFNLFCEKMCQRKYPLKKDMFADLITLYSILSICYFEDIAVILKMAEISNVKRKDLEDILAKINSRKDSQNSTGFRFQYDLISKVKMELENRAFPDFEDRDFDLIKCKNTYATIAAMKRDDNEVDIESNYNIRFLLILIDLILLLDRGSQSSKGDEIQAKRKTMIQQNIELTYKSIRDTFILPILKNDWRALLYNKSESHLKALTLVLSELFIAEAECGDFTTFADNQLKELLHELDTVLEKEKKYVNTIPSQLASYVANLIPEVVCLKDLEHLLALINNRPDEMSEGNKQDDDAKNTVDLVVRERVQNVSKSLISKLNISGNKAHKEFAIAFSDKLTFRFFEKATSSRPDGQRLLLEDDKMLELLKYFAKDARFTNESNGKTSLQNILFGATLRFLFKSGLMNYLEDPNIISQVESLQYLSFDFSSPNALLENRNLLPVLYYLQEYYLSQLGAQDKGTHLKLIEDANNELIRVKHSNNIVFFSKGITKMLKSVENVMKVPDDQKSKFFADFSKDHNLNACFLVGVAIINELDFETKSENSSPDQLKNFANKALQELFAKPSDDMNSIKQYFESLVKNMMDPKTIQSLSYSTTQAEDQKADGEGNQAKRTEDSEESVDEFKFRQLLYQFILTVTCFQPVFNYDLELAKSWLKKMDQSRLKLPLASNDKLTNMGVVFETILVTRLSDGSYQDYGEELCKNLGIYQCVCKYVYTIGQCGYAVSTDTCPSCGRPIGGKDHRTNNTNIKTLQELQSLIRDEYMKVKSEYQLHTPINTSHPALALIKLLELKTQEEILSYLQQTHVHASTRYYDHLLFMRHLWDHMYLLLCPELIGSQGKGADPFFAQFDQMIQKSKSKSKDNKDQLDYFFENKKIGNSKQYLMTHIKNDLNQLRAVLGLKNNAQVIDFLRVSLIKIGEKLMNKEVTDSGNDLAKLIDFNDLDNPLELLRSYQTNIDDTFGEGMNKLEQAELLKDLVYSKDITSKLGISPSLPTFQLHYDLLRHNVLGKDMILRQFKEKLKTTKRKFLRALVEDNQIILKHFPKIMDAHVKLGLYFNIKYEKAFQIQDLKSLTVGDLQPADQTLENYLKDLVQVWREQLQMSEYQQKLNYSFECEENIEMEDFYSDITQNELQDVPLNNLALSSAASTKLSVAVQSLLKSVHNKYVKEINLILGIEALEQKEQKKLEDCTEEDYMSCFDFESVVLNNFWFNPNIEKQDEINFDFNKIEYICAKFMKKSLINPTPKNYKENSDDVTDDRQNIEKFINDLPFKRLPEEIERRMRELKDNELANTYKFFCEMAVHGFNMVMGTNLNQTMTDIVKEASHGGSFSKFKYFDSSLHGSITLEYLPHCFRIVKEGRMNYFIDLNSQDWTSVKNQYKFTNFEDEIFNKLVETMSQMRQDRNMAQAKQIVRGLLDAMVDFVHYELVDHIEGRNPDPIKVICAKQFSSERNFSRNISKNLGIRSDLAEEISEMRVCQIEMIKDRLISELNDLISRH